VARHQPLRYWLPRLLLGAFALSLVFPLPRYLGGMEAGEYLMWLSQAAWVLICAAGLGGLGLLGRWWRRRRDRGE
jgi:hypothetical protein